MALYIQKNLPRKEQKMLILKKNNCLSFLEIDVLKAMINIYYSRGTSSDVQNTLLLI